MDYGLSALIEFSTGNAPRSDRGVSGQGTSRCGATANQLPPQACRQRGSSRGAQATAERALGLNVYGQKS